MTKSLREEMPEVTALMDSLREVFGKEMIDQQIRKGLNGKPTFWARENGHRLGTRNTVHTSAIVRDEHGIARSTVPEWIDEAREYARRRGVVIKPADPDSQIDIEREAEELRQMMVAARANGGKGNSA